MHQFRTGHSVLRPNAPIWPPERAASEGSPAIGYAPRWPGPAGGVRPIHAGAFLTFDSLGLSADLLRTVAEEGYIKPTPVQAAAIPLVLAGA